MEAMREAGDVASSVHTLSSPGFTPINHISPELCSPLRPTTSYQKQHTTPKAQTTSRSSRRRNSTVASYLGLGSSTEPNHLMKYGPTSDNHVSPTQATRRRRVARGSEQTLATKRKSAAKRAPKGVEAFHTSALTEPAVECSDHQASAAENIKRPDGIPPQLEMPVGCAVLLDDSDDDFGQLCFDFEPTAQVANEQTYRAQPSNSMQLDDTPVDEEDYGDDLADEDLFGLNADKSDQRVNSSNSSLSKFTSPVTLTTRLLAATDYEPRKPFVRPPFPAAMRDRSPIIGMSSDTLLRTCFRIGEAINQSCQAAKTGRNILIELYARVLSSERDDLQQCFTFCDLFHANPPYIQATYAAVVWKSVPLFEYDSGRLLQQGRICRCIGTMERNGKGWSMTVLNIWEATWDDVDWVKGIVQS